MIPPLLSPYGPSTARARSLMSSVAAAAVAQHMETDEPPTIGSLPDALLQHALSYLSSDLAALGRMLCTSAALSATAKDDAVWGPLCRSRFGLDGLYGPERESCASYWHAARAWAQLCVQLGGPKLWEQMRMVAAITEGARVTLVGLSRVELNGRCGRALRRLPQEAQAAGRWEIEIDGQPAAVLSIKTENLRLCDTPLVPMLAPLWTRAAGAWRVLAAWAEATLPELHATLAPPADSQAWANPHADPKPPPPPPSTPQPSPQLPPQPQHPIPTPT